MGTSQPSTLAPWRVYSLAKCKLQCYCVFQGSLVHSFYDPMKFKRSSCPITNVLDLLGDKWTLLVIRDLVLGKRRYQEFLASPEEMASNILAERLSRLLAAGLIHRHAYQRNPVRYEYFLSKRGQGLEPILEAIIVWGKKQYPGTKKFPRVRTSRTRTPNDSNR